MTIASSGALEPAAPRGRANRRALLGGALAAGGIAYLAWSGLRSTLVYYLTVGEVLSGGSADGRPVRVSGHVVDGSLTHDAAAGLLAFTITDGSGGLPVVFRGVKPDMLGYSNQDAYQDVVVEGRVGSDGVLHASNLIVKHGAEFRAAGSPNGRSPGVARP